MSDKSEIEWTDATWNPVRGCTKVSPGCKHCYAETFAERFRGVDGHPYEQGFDPRLVPEALAIPLRWKRPRMIFVNSMSDLFHEDVPFEYIAAVFGVMALASHHTFQVLTKRAARMAEFFAWVEKRAVDGLSVFPNDSREWRIWQMIYVEAVRRGVCKPNGLHYVHHGGPWPLPNVWLGVSVESQQYADERIPKLLECPAAARFLSVEPLLGPVNLREVAPHDDFWTDALDTPDPSFKVSWVIVGGESGAGARPMHPDWVRSIRDQCIAAHVPFFFKQWGAWHTEIDRDRDDPDQRRDYTIKNPKRLRVLNLAGGHGFHGERVHLVERVGKAKAGRLLDGRTWDEMPATAKKSRSAA